MMAFKLSRCGSSELIDTVLNYVSCNDTDTSTYMHICDITSILCSKTVGCIIVLRPFDLGHFEHGQLAYPHCS